MVKSYMIEGSKSEILAAFAELNEPMVRAIVLVDDSFVTTSRAQAVEVDEWERKLDALMANAPHNPKPLRLTRDAMERVIR